MPSYLHVDTVALTPRDVFGYWRDRVTPLRLEPVPATAEGFQVRADVLRSGHLSVIEMTRGPARATWRRTAGAEHDRLRLILLASAAGAVGSWYGTAVPFGRGGAVLAGANDGWWRAPAGMHGIEVDLPREEVPVSDAELVRIGEQHRLASDPVFQSLVRPLLAGMAGHLGALAGTAGTDLGRSWVALLTMLVRSLTERDLDGTDLASGRRVLAERYVREHLSDPQLTPDAVAAALHVSRRALYASVFREEGGVAAHIRAQRLARAHHLLTTTAAPISSVAAAVGLPDPAHFTRAFRSAFGVSPRDARAAGRHGDVRDPPKLGQ